MTPEQEAAYVQANATAALIEAMGMMANNQNRLAQGISIQYGQSDFQALIEKYGIHHNAIMRLYSQQ